MQDVAGRSAPRELTTSVSAATLPSTACPIAPAIPGLPTGQATARAALGAEAVTDVLDVLDSSVTHVSGTDLVKLERAKGFEPSTPTLARSCSTPELHPHPRSWRRWVRRQRSELCQMRPMNATTLGRPEPAVGLHGLPPQGRAQKHR